MCRSRSLGNRLAETHSAIWDRLRIRTWETGELDSRFTGLAGAASGARRGGRGLRALSRELSHQRIHPATRNWSAPRLRCVWTDDRMREPQFVVDFSYPERGLRVPVSVPARSLWVIRGEARSEWRHAIAARLTDQIDGEHRPRGRRISITFRTAKR